jgi:hypothetical protein
MAVHPHPTQDEILITEAAKCHLNRGCKQTGKLVSSKRIRDEDGDPCDIAVYECQTDLCPRVGERWLVQSDPRGVVYQRPPAGRGGGIEHTFPHMTPDQLAQGRRAVEQAQLEMMRQELDAKEQAELEEKARKAGVSVETLLEIRELGGEDR